MNHYVPTRIVFGRGKMKDLHNQKFPGKNALIVISSGLSVKKNGYLDTLVNELNVSGISCQIYSGIYQNPDCAQIMEGAAKAKEFESDFVIGFGGGSCMDAAKAIAVTSVNEGNIWEYMQCRTGNGRRTKRIPLPVVTIPTTSGSGSQIDPWTTITNRITHEKAGYGYTEMFPVISVIDPELMTSVPQIYTIYQGFDMLFHLIECYISRGANWFSDMYVIKGLELWKENFIKTVWEGKDIDAREKMAMADICAGMAMCNCPVTSLHTLEHAVSGWTPNLPHGAGLLLLAEHWLFYMERYSIIKERMEVILKLLKPDIAEENMSMIRLIHGYLAECGINKMVYKNFERNAAKPEEYLKLAGDSVKEIFVNDRVILTEQEVCMIYQKMLQAN